MPTKRSLSRQLQDARNQIRGLVEERDKAAASAGTGQFNTVRLAAQLAAARGENDELRRQLAARPATPAPDPGRVAVARLRQELRLSEQARASLDAQILDLGRVNDRLCREAQDRAVAAEVTR